jgi:hypothetical protein
METDKRSTYVLVIVILANIVAFFGTALYQIYDQGLTFSLFLKNIVDGFNISLFVGGISLFISLIPALIVNSNFRNKNLLGFGIPILVILYATIHFFTCEGKWCNLIDIPIGFGGLIFVLFFGLNILVLRWSKKFSLSIIWIQTAIIFCSIVLVSFNFYHSDFKLNKAFNDESISDQSAVSICEEIKDHKWNCWNKLVEIRQPETNICVFANEANYQSCFYGLRGAYNDHEQGKNIKNWSKVCENIVTQTMEKYNIKNTDDFMYAYLPERSSKYLNTAMEIIRSCDSNTQPYKDLDQISRALSSEYKHLCIDVEDSGLKNKCIQYFTQFDN